MRKTMAAVMAVAFSLATALPAQARECAGVNLPESVQVDGTRLVLNGLGIREATVLQVNVYVAGLYVESRSTNADDILNTDAKRRVVLSFLRDVDRGDIVEAFETGFRHNAGPGLPAMQPKIRQLLSWVTNVREGDTMTFTYVPGRGTEFAIGSRSFGTIEGADFGRAVTALFIGPRPPNPGLRRGLLGGRCG